MIVGAAVEAAVETNALISTLNFPGNKNGDPTYVSLILQMKVGAAIEAAFSLHGANNSFGTLRCKVDSCHHLMNIRPVYNLLVWNVPHAHLQQHEPRC